MLHPLLKKRRKKKTKKVALAFGPLIAKEYKPIKELYIYIHYSASIYCSGKVDFTIPYGNAIKIREHGTCEVKLNQD